MTPKELFERCNEEIRIFERPSAENSKRLLVLAATAVAYIDENPCDPDIYPEQWEAWEEYQRVLKIIERA